MQFPSEKRLILSSNYINEITPLFELKSSPKVTVIIVNWNGEKFIKQCLEALTQLYKPAHEIIVVDNASSDGSLAILEKFPTVRLLKQGTNLGFAKANNLAIQAASSESSWIALLNPDAFVQPDWLVELLKAAFVHADFKIFSSKLLNSANPNVLDGTGDAYHISGQAWRTGHGLPLSPASEVTREVFSPCAAAALYYRSALEAVGGFDEDYFCYFEDVDLGFRLRLAGHRCLYVPQSVAHHVGSGTTGGQGSDFATYYGHRNLVWTFVKDMPSLLFWLLLPLHLMLNLATLFWFVLHGRGRLILRAKRHAVAGLPRMWRKRQLIQSGRVASLSSIWAILDKRLLTTKASRKEP